MPKGTKAAPPQQASLNELWKKGKGAASKNASDAAEDTTKLQKTEGRLKDSDKATEEGGWHVHQPLAKADAFQRSVVSPPNPRSPREQKFRASTVISIRLMNNAYSQL